MQSTAWCTECNAHVWVTPDGGCSNGHPRSSLGDVPEAWPPPASSETPLEAQRAAPVSSNTATPSAQNPNSPEMKKALELHKLKSQVKGATMWLVIVGALTFYNAYQWADGRNGRMISGLMATRLLTKLVVRMGPSGQVVEVVAAALVFALFLGLAWLAASKEQAWALLLGSVIYAADTLLFVPYRDYLGIGFHIFGLVFIVQGYLAVRTLHARTQTQGATLPSSQVPQVLALSSSVAAWHHDPTGRHEHRFWDGTAWTEHVADRGQVAVDRLSAPL